VFHVSIWGGLKLCLGGISPPMPLVATGLNLPCNEMSLFCYIARSFSNRRHCVYFTLQLIWVNVVFVSVVTRVFTLSFVLRIVLNKLKTTR